MKKSTKVMVALGVVAGLGVAALPLGSSFAACAEGATGCAEGNVTLTAKVGTAYGISATAPALLEVTPNASNATTQSADITASANGNYSITAKSTALTISGTETTIPPVSGSNAVDGTNSAWGISTSATGGTDDAFVDVVSGSKTIASGSSITNANAISVTYGVSAAASQANGQYTAEVTYTIAAPN